MTRSVPITALASATAFAALLTAAGCTSTDVLSGDKLDYKSKAETRSIDLAVPPDLTQLTRDPRYQQSQNSAVSAAAYQAITPVAAASAAAASTEATPIAPQAIGDLRIERLGNDRWLHTPLSADQIWPQIQNFWKDRGFVIVQDAPVAGVLETDWAENRAKLPQDFVRRTLGKVIDQAYSTGELDKFRTRVERVPGGTDVYITHRGMVELYTGERRDSTTWEPRKPDPQLEGELLSLLMVKLGAPAEVAKLQVAATNPNTGVPEAGRARLLASQPGTALQVDDNFDRAWRRVGVALDRSGFTVEDRDRGRGLYFVRYIDPKFAGREEPNIFSKLFSFGKKDDSNLARYRVSVKGEGANSSTVSVQNNEGAPETGDAGKRITKMLLDDLK